MKILFLTTHFNTGGITSYILTLGGALVKSGHEVWVASSGGENVVRLEAAGMRHVRIDIRTKRVKILSAAYSFRYIAHPIPKGTAKTAVITVIAKVPTIAGKIPPALIPFRGICDKNSQEIADQPFSMIKNKIKITGSTTINVDKDNSANAIRCLR